MTKKYIFIFSIYLFFFLSIIYFLLYFFFFSFILCYKKGGLFSPQGQQRQVQILQQLNLLSHLLYSMLLQHLCLHSKKIQNSTFQSHCMKCQQFMMHYYLTSWNRKCSLNCKIRCKIWKVPYESWPEFFLFWKSWQWLPWPDFKWSITWTFP